MKIQVTKIIVSGVFLLSLLVPFGCETLKGDDQDDKQGKEEQQEEKTDVDSTKSVFVLPIKDFPAKVDVSIDKTPLFSVQFEYDRFNRLKSYRKQYTNICLEDAAISHVSNTQAEVAYRQFDSEFSSKLVVRVSSGYLVWSYSNMSNANRYAVLMDSSRWPVQYGYNVQYSAKKYSNLVSFKLNYSMEDGNVKSMENATVSTSTGSNKTVSVCAPEPADAITYSDMADNANLGAFLIASEFLPWYMKGLPGNKRLISKIEHSINGRMLDEYEEIQYEQKEGRISKITETYYAGKNVLHKKEYNIQY